MPITMQPPLQPGITLVNRYRLIQILGQGGFGRTYLAEDQNRFREYCVLKELVPAQTTPELMQKARELFYKEAKVLYSIQHPQVPEFREQFEFDRRLFLVQQYVAGKTCSQLLDERLQQGLTFSEAETKQLLLQVLPVLTYLHDRHIIHRDISPDNIILRSSDRLPVLIDFGAVKALATRVSQPASHTIIGKPLYAPAEQMQAGIVDPTSDLYALAVTAIELLTGKSPDQLYDSRQGQWRWQNVARVSPDFAAVLNRMLSSRSPDRIPSAAQVLPLLQSTSIPATPVQIAPPPPSPASQLPTQAIGQPPIYPNPAVPTPVPPDWARMAERAGTIALRFGRWSSRAVWFVAGGLVRFVWSLIPKWLVLLALIFACAWTYQRLTGKSLLPKLPRLPIPRIEMPRIQMPPFRLPSIQLPTLPNSDDVLGAGNASPSEQRRQDAILQRQKALRIDSRFFNQLVNEQFFAKHPELAGEPLSPNDPKQQSLRNDWYRTAETTLNRLQNLLSRESRDRLGSFTAEDLDRGRAQLPRYNLSDRALYDLADTRLLAVFPEQSNMGERLNQPIGQVWQGVVSDYLNAIQAGKAWERISPQSSGWRDQFEGNLSTAAGKAYVVYLKPGQSLQAELEAEEDVAVSSYSPTGRVLLNRESRQSWSTAAKEEGYYEVVVLSQARSPLSYRLNLAID